MHRLFLLSPPNCAGVRARGLLEGRSRSDLARQLAAPEGARVGELAAFLSSLYFRGKLAYARRFGRAPSGAAPALMITPDRGLISVQARIALSDLRAFASVPIDLREPRYVEPLTRSARALTDAYAGEICEFVLLGSIATDKYIDCLWPILGPRLVFPADFVGRGDMSRGGLMLRCAASGVELRYVPLHEAVRKGKRPAKLPKEAARFQA